jgi:hypothetical protein
MKHTLLATVMAMLLVGSAMSMASFAQQKSAGGSLFPITYATYVVVKNASGRRRTKVALEANLYMKSSGRPLEGQPIQFYVANRFVGGSATDRNGLARVFYRIPSNAALGDTLIRASFPGYLIHYYPSTGTGVLRVFP